MLYDKIISDMKTAMVNKDKDSLNTIRLLKSAIDLNRINNKLESITDDLVIEVTSKQVKTHRESIEQFSNAGRTDLVDGLLKEIKLLESYLPVQFTIEEINSLLDEIFNEIKPSGKQDLGKVMKEVSAKFKGKADMKTVSSLVNERITNI